MFLHPSDVSIIAVARPVGPPPETATAVASTIDMRVPFHGAVIALENIMSVCHKHKLRKRGAPTEGQDPSPTE
jgi:hypothetical protein